MAESILPPDPQILLPPLFACLLAAFVSSRPPPALLSLLSPILRQRVQILSDIGAAPSDSWLRLLCWDEKKAEQVLSAVDAVTSEPDLVSGEFEIPQKESITYRRLDEETLRSQILLPEFHISVLYEWCSQEEEVDRPGWRLVELLPWDSSANEDNTWSASISEADSRAAAIQREQPREATTNKATENTAESSLDENEDNYWALYDSSFSKIPSIEVSRSHVSTTCSPPLAAEDPYFARYADVQPALDNDDPSRQAEDSESSLQGNIFSQLIRQHLAERDLGKEQMQVNGSPARVEVTLNHPRPSSSSSGSDAVARLEQQARSQSASEIGVKQHITSSFKSLYHLAQSTGITGGEFRELVLAELEQLCSGDNV